MSLPWVEPMPVELHCDPGMLYQLSYRAVAELRKWYVRLKSLDFSNDNPAMLLLRVRLTNLSLFFITSTTQTTRSIFTSSLTEEDKWIEEIGLTRKFGTFSARNRTIPIGNRQQLIRFSSQLHRRFQSHESKRKLILLKKSFFCFFEEKKFLKISAMRSKNVLGPAFSFLGQTKLLRNFRRRVLRKRQSPDGRIVSQFRIGQLLSAQITY